jgi:hypothetical protein
LGGWGRKGKAPICRHGARFIVDDENKLVQNVEEFEAIGSENLGCETCDNGLSGSDSEFLF